MTEPNMSGVGSPLEFKDGISGLELPWVGEGDGWEPSKFIIQGTNLVRKNSGHCFDIKIGKESLTLPS